MMHRAYVLRFFTLCSERCQLTELARCSVQHGLVAMRSDARALDGQAIHALPLLALVVAQDPEEVEAALLEKEQEVEAVEELLSEEQARFVLMLAGTHQH